MFERFITTFIKRYVARYISINADQISAQLLYKQQITIENLTVNQAAINEDIRNMFQLPINIESIHIAKIQCSFSWSNFLFRSGSTPMFVKIDHIHIVLKQNDDNLSTVIVDENNQINKKNYLDSMEQQLEKEFECFGEVKSSRWNYRRFLVSLFEKLQIEIVNIHISYKSSTDYTIGMTCNSIRTLNQSENEMKSRQMFQIVNLRLYIDINNSSTHSYVFSSPTSMELFLTHNYFTFNQKEYFYELELLWNDIDMKFNNEQIRILADIIRFIKHVSHHRILISNPSRPRSKISKQTVKTWWRYATLTILRMQSNLRKSTVTFWFDRSLFLYRLHQLNRYKYLYNAYLDKRYGKYSTFSSQDELMMNNIEIEFNIEHLIFIRRSIFEAKINRQLKNKKEPCGWYSSYAKWITSKAIDYLTWMSTSEDTNNFLNENDIQLQEQLNAYIEESIKEQELLENSYKALIFRYKFTLKSIQINLLSSTNTILFNFCLKNLLLMSEFRLRDQSICVSMSLEDLSIRDQEKTDDKFSTIISSKKRSEQE